LKEHRRFSSAVRQRVPYYFDLGFSKQRTGFDVQKHPTAVQTIQTEIMLLLKGIEGALE